MRSTALFRRFALPLACFGALISASMPSRASGEVAADPPVITPGDSVKLKWYFTGDKVTVSGGKFGSGQVVTGKMQVTDSPRKTTQYRFDVYYTIKKVGADGIKTSEALHQHYFVTALVDDSPPDQFKSYSDPHGWKIKYLAGWKYDVSTPDDGNKALLFFQREYDSVERMAVAIVPANGMTSSDVLAKALSDTPGRYQAIKVEPTEAVRVGALPGSMASFSGDDESHPGVRTTSLLYAVVYSSRAYIISARTRASNYLLRKAHLERMLKSFAIDVKVVGDLPFTRQPVDLCREI